MYRLLNLIQIAHSHNLKKGSQLYSSKKPHIQHGLKFPSRLTCDSSVWSIHKSQSNKSSEVAPSVTLSPPLAPSPPASVSALNVTILTCPLSAGKILSNSFVPACSWIIFKMSTFSPLTGSIGRVSCPKLASSVSTCCSSAVSPIRDEKLLFKQKFNSNYFKLCNWNYQLK